MHMACTSCPSAAASVFTARLPAGRHYCIKETTHEDFIAMHTYIDTKATIMSDFRPLIESELDHFAGDVHVELFFYNGHPPPAS